MKKLLSLFVCGLMALSMTAAELNIYASGLKAGEVNDNKVEISYVLNAPATEVEVQLLDGNAVAASLKLTDAALLTKGAHTTTIDLGTVAAGDYAWAVQASAAATTEVANCAVVASDAGALAGYNFYLPQGCAVDNSPASPYFGQIYVALPYAGQSDGLTDRTKNQTAGLYVYDPLLKELNPTAAGYSLGLTFAGKDRQEFKRVAVDEAGMVYVNNNSTGKTIYQIDPKDFTKCTSLFGETKPFTSLNSIAVSGSGDNLVVYALDNANTTTGGGTIVKFSGKAPYTKADTILQSDKFANSDNSIVLDGKGGLWVCQHRYSVDAYNILTHVNAKGEIDFAINKTENTSLAPAEPVSYRGYLAINPEGNVIALGGGKTINLYDVTYDATTGVPTLVKQSVAFPTMGNNIDGIAFDVAGNVYVACASTELFYAYVVPKAKNVCTTPGQGTITVTAAPAPVEEDVYVFLSDSVYNSKNTDYTKLYNMTVNGLAWSVPGNTSTAKDGGWYRIGGKSLDKVERVLTSKEPIGGPVSKLVVSHYGCTSDKLTLDSAEVIVASDTAFANVIDRVKIATTIAKNTDGSFDLVASTAWPADSYYKIIFTISNPNASNYAFQLKSIAWKKAASVDPVPTLESAVWNLIGDSTETCAEYKNQTDLVAGTTLTQGSFSLKAVHPYDGIAAQKGNGMYFHNSTESKGDNYMLMTVPGNQKGTLTVKFRPGKKAIDYQIFAIAQDASLAAPTGMSATSAGAVQVGETKNCAGYTEETVTYDFDFLSKAADQNIYIYVISTSGLRFREFGYAETEVAAPVVGGNAKVTWDLNGGFANALGVTAASEMYQALAKDVIAAKKAGFAFTFLDGFGDTRNEFGAVDVTGGTGLAFDVSAWDMTFCKSAMFVDKWGWLEDYIKETAEAAGKAWNSSAAFRYAVTAFFANSVRPNWPASADYATIGVSSDAWLATWGQYFELPAEYATNVPLPNAYREGYNFIGWFNGDTQVYSVTEDCALTAKWEKKAYNVTWNLDGGFANALGYANATDLRAAMYQALAADVYAAKADGFAFSFASSFAGTFGEADVTGTTGVAFDIVTFDMTFFDVAPYAAKWGWLRDYIKDATEAQGGTWNSTAAMRYALAAFFSNSQRPNWPASIDYKTCGISSTAWESYVTFEYPATWAELDELPVPTKPGYNFLGWFDAAGKQVTKVTADVALTAQWQLAKYTWVMNGGSANNLCIAKAEDMYQALAADVFAAKNNGTCSAFAFASNFAGKFGQVDVGGATGVAFDIVTFDMTFFDVAPYAAKWGWLRDYIKTASEAQEKAWNSSAAMRYALAAFFSDSIRATWPASIDYANCGISSDAWMATWGGVFEFPETFAADQEAPKAYRTNWEFAGWYKTEDFSGDAVTTVGPKSTCTLYAKFNPTAAAVQGVALDTDTLRFQMPATGTLVATITPETAVNKTIVWTSSNENIATVADGVITALMPGEVTITVTTEESNYTAKAVVVITAAPGAVTGVSFSETAKTIEIGESFDLTYAITPDTAYNKDVTIVLSDSAVISYVDNKVTALQKGTSTITVTTVDGNYKATCTVTVPEARDANFVVEKIWEAPATATMTIADARQGSGWDGKIYFTNKKDSMLYEVSVADGAGTEKAIVNMGVNGSGMAIDDAGNIVMEDNFPNAAVKKISVLFKGATEPKVLEFDGEFQGTTDAGDAGYMGRTDFINAFGDMSSAEGGYVYFYSTGATHLQYVKVTNGAKEASDVVFGYLPTEVIKGSSTAYVMRADDKTFLSHCRGNWFEYFNGTEIVKWGSDKTPYMYTSDMGGDLITLKDQNGNDKTILLYNVSTLAAQKRTSEFAVRNLTDDMMIPDAEDNATHYTIDKNKVISNNCYAIWMKVQKVDDYTAYVHQFISGLGMSYWKISTNFNVSGVALNKTATELGINETEALVATITPEQATNKNVTWTSSNEEVATVSAEGVVTGVAEGEAVITVTTEDGNFTATCTVKVEAVAYKLVKDLAEITDGTKVLFVNEAAAKAMAEQKANNRGTVAVEINAGYIKAAPAAAQVVKVGVASDGYTFGVGAEYLYAAGGGNYLRSGENAEVWNITLADGVFGIVSTANVEQNVMRYNTSSGGLFSCYKAENNQKDVAIYKQIKASELPLVYSVTVPEGTKECWIAGDMNGWAFTQMEAVDATHYTLAIEGATTAHGYKYLCHNNWDYVEKGANGEEITNRVYSEADVVLAWARLWTAVEDVTINGVYYSNGMIYNPMGIELFVYTAAGQLVAHDSQNIDMTAAANGTYIIRAASGNVKFIK